MLKHVLYASAALAFLAAPSLAAATVSQSVILNGNVPLTCTLSVPHPTMAFPSLTAIGGQQVFGIFQGGSAMCNGSKNTVTVSVTPLIAQDYVGLPPMGFTNIINYTLTVDGLLPLSPPLNTSSPSSSTGKQFRPAFNINLTDGTATTLGTGVLQPVGGNYSGTVTITLTAANS